MKIRVLTHVSGDIVGQSAGKVTDDDLVSLCKPLTLSETLPSARPQVIDVVSTTDFA